MAAQVFFGGERQLRQLVEAGDVVGLQAGGVEDGPVVGAVVVGVADRVAQPGLLQGAQFVGGGGLDRVERRRAGAGRWAWSAPQVLVEEVFDDGHDLDGGPLPGLAAAQRQLAVSGSGQQVVGAVGAGGAQRLVQQQGLGGRDDAVVVAVQEQERWGGGPDEVDRVGVGMAP